MRAPLLAALGIDEHAGYLSPAPLYLTDRRHHMIISGGVNIYPQEAENLLIGYPRVLDAAVFGIPDAAMGESVKAVVQLIDPAEASDDFAEELLDWTDQRGLTVFHPQPNSSRV